MANTTGVTAVAERPIDVSWLSTPRIAVAGKTRPSGRAAVAEATESARAAVGQLNGLPGAVTDMALSADGRQLVAAHYGADAISVIDIATLTINVIVAGIAEPYAVAVADRAYVTSASNDQDSVVAIDLKVGAALAAKEITDGARGIAVSPGGDELYVARCGDQIAEIAVIDIESGESKTIALTSTAEAWVDAVRVSADGSRLFVALTDATGGSLAVIDVRARRVLHTVALGGSIGDVAVDADRRRVLVTGWNDELGAVVRIVDAVAGRVVDTVVVDGMGAQVVVSGTAAYLALGDGVLVIDTVTARIITRIDTANPVSAIAVGKDGTRLYVGDFDGAITAVEVAQANRELRAAS